MAKLIATRGYPGSGKTTWARGEVAKDLRRRVRANRDDQGYQLHGRRFYEDPDLMQSTEKAITLAQHAQISKLLQHGWDVYCDDTNLARRVMRDLRNLAVRAGAEFQIHDMLDVPFETVLAQNALRQGTPGYVPEDVIENMRRRYGGKNAYAVPLEPEPVDAFRASRPYEPVPGTPLAIMVDVDGTVAIMGDRSPFDETRVGEDEPNMPVIRTIRAMHTAGYLVIFCSGRKELCYQESYDWLQEHVQVPIEGLFMRPATDMRKDSLVKVDLFNEHIRDNYTVVGVWDDRDQVVKAWRELGLTVYQVAEGDF